ncbi:hypothetical protein RHGRI_004084 [Rhododendron griersonianum]|uniref:non-specific serine/threonine protein kinase n=1 Tax=Rhododendron griersonianum TaxID=479676 RepID=A0AAV6L9Y2_9ERIC|nr:hypothetical protein RHGRI_004084 [Rhododendron griersonianum]
MASVPKTAPNFQAAHSIIIFVFVIILIPFVSSSDSAVARASPATKTIAKQSEAVALLKWKASLDNQSQSLLSSWNETSHCTWVGIGCNEASKVTNLTLDGIGLRGTLSSLNFSSLPHLVKLDMSNNLIYGTIPSQIGSLSRNLRTLELEKPHNVVPLREFSLWIYPSRSRNAKIDLELSTNNLTGLIPASIGNLRNLTTLYLYENSLSGSIPQEVGMLRSLTDLELSTNNLTGLIPASIGNLRNLTTLYLYENSLSGSIPQEVGMLRSLTNLELSTNNLTGLIPASIGNLRNLTTLYLYKNSLSGSIPQEVGMVRSLTDLELSMNNLTGSIPASIGNLRNLRTLYLHTNSLSGSIPQEVGMLRSLTDLELSTNNLTGLIPASIGNLRNLTTLYLDENSLSGSIPQEVGMLRSLTDLALSTNNLTGSIPASIGNLRNLIKFVPPSLATDSSGPAALLGAEDLPHRRPVLVELLSPHNVERYMDNYGLTSLYRYNLHCADRGVSASPPEMVVRAPLITALHLPVTSIRTEVEKKIDSEGIQKRIKDGVEGEE